ncbi:MAG: PAS domain S-box protein, partial [Elainellaceae cyanobacterium]
VTWSEELFHIAGLDPAQFEPSYPEDFALIHPDDRDQIRLAADAAIARGTPYEVEHRVVRSDGTTRHLVSRGEAVLGLHGEVIKLVGTASDISDRKQAEALIRASEARYRGVVEDQTEFICRFQPDGTLTFVNSSYCRYFGRLEAELLGFNLLDLVPDTDRQEVAQLLADLRSLTPANPTVTQEHSALTLDGQVVWQQWTNRAIFDATGQLVEFQAVGRDITERRRAEEALQQSQAQLQLVTDSVHGCISYVDSSRRYRFVNHAYERWFGCQKADVLGRTVAEVIGTEAYRRAQRHIERVFAGETVDYEAEMPYQTGGTRYISAVLVPDINDQGETLGYYALIVDISDRKRVEMALEQTNRQLQAFLDNAPAAIAMFDVNGRYYRVNRKFTQLFQLAASAIVGQTFDVLFPKAIADLFRTRIQQLATTRQSLEIEDEIEIDGDRRIYRSILFPVVNFSDIEQTPQQFWTIALDITERKRIEVALQEKTDELDRFFSVALDLLCIADTDGYFRRLNLQWEKTLGYSLSELENTSFTDYVHPDDRQATLEVLAALAEQRVVSGFVNRYRCRDGTYRWIEWRSVPVGNQIYAAARDITSRKQAESQIQQALKEKEVLLQEVHHRVKNNLQLIQSMLRMQQRRLNNPEAAQILQESCNRVVAIGLVHEILYQSNNLAQIDLADYIPAIVQHVMASSRSIGRSITVNTQIQSVIVPMKKAICCGLILNELVTNALKYAFPGGQEGQINIDLSVIANSQWDVISLVVRDNGVGLPAGLDLAEPNSLGLTLVQDFVAQLQGSLGVASVQGTQFSITFRVKHHDAASPQ